MIEFYWICIASFVMGISIGIGTRLWNTPATKPPIEVGNVVHFRCQHSAGVFKVIAECVPPSGRRSLLVERIDPRCEVVRAAWASELELERIYSFEAVA